MSVENISQWTVQQSLENKAIEKMEQILKNAYKILCFQENTVNTSFTAMSLSGNRNTTLDYVLSKPHK